MRPYLILFVLFFSCNDQHNNIRGQKPGRPMELEGNWAYEKPDSTLTFVLALKQLGDSVYGNYCAIYQAGRRIDCSDDTLEINIRGKILSDSALVYFESFFGATDGIASLKKNGNKLIWQIIQEPRGESYYAPPDAVLHRRD